MSFEPDPDFRFCPFCGAEGVEVDETRDDYYVGPIRRCPSCKEGFYATEANPTPERYREPTNPEIAALSEMIARHAIPAQRELNARKSMLLEELERKRPPGGDVIRIPLRPAP